MKKLAVLLLSTMLLAGCSSSNHIIMNEDDLRLSNEAVDKICERLDSFTQQNAKYIQAAKQNEEENEEEQDTEELDEQLVYTEKIQEQTGRFIYVNTMWQEEYGEQNRYQRGIPSDESFIDLAERLDPGVKAFIEEQLVKKSDVVKLKAKIFENSIIVVNPLNSIESEEGERLDTVDSIAVGFITRQIKDNPEDTLYKNILDQIQTKDFVVSDLSVGSDREMLEISNAFYCVGQQMDVHFYTRDAQIRYELPAQVAYRIYTDKIKADKLRLVIIKQKGIDVTDKDMVPLAKSLELMGISSQNIEEDIVKLIKDINQDKLGTRKGKIGEGSYLYKGTKDIRRYKNVEKTLIEIVIE